jgi:hypothetical protein
MENSLKTILIAAGVVITLIVVSIGFFIMNQGQNTAKQAMTKIDKVNSQLTESDLMMYDGLEISGSDVVNAINKFKQDKSRIAIMVKTYKDSTGVWYVYDGSSIDTLSVVAAATMTTRMINIQDPSNTAYATPAGRFKGLITRDSNGTIATLTFTQV